MGIADLFVIRSRRLNTAVFTAPQSLTSFGVGICIVASISRAGRTILRMESDSIVVPLAAALIVGAGILAVVAGDEDTRPRGPGEWATAVCVGLVNSLVLFVAALGIDKF